MSIKQTFLASVSLVLLAACSQQNDATTQTTSTTTEDVTVSSQDPSKALLDLLDEEASEILQASPETATSLGVSEDIAGIGFSARLADYSLEADAQAREMNQKFLRAMGQVNEDDLAGTAAISYQVMENAFQTAEERNQFSFGGASIMGSSPPYVLTQLSGVHLYLPRLLLTEQPLTTPEDAQAWLSRLSEIDRVLSETGARIQIDAVGGVIPPHFAMQGISGSLRGFVSAPAEIHPLYQHFSSKVDEMADLDETRKEELKATALTTLKQEVYPAYNDLATIVEDLTEQASDEAGIWAIDQGDAYYQHALRSYGAGDMTAEQVHQKGLEEVARISAEMDTILKSMGYMNGGVGERFAALAKAEGMIYPNTEEGRQELLQILRDQVEEVNNLAPDWFGTLPPQQVLVKRIPVYEQDNSAGGYYTGPSLDGTRPGIYWINLKDTADWPKYTLKTLTYHEAVPGHHFQISLQQAVKDMPLIRNLLFYSEFGEGWALYAEQVAAEMGLYKDDPLGNLGRLQSELFRAARLVVDTGIHYKKWSREEAIDYMVETTGDTRASLTREVERYAVWPGQATSYKLGMLKIDELRSEAEATLGEHFDIKQFHDAVLLDGSMPLPVLEHKIHKWVVDMCQREHLDCDGA
ncbi:MAG: DUF885 domain-containing protein [bacterium]